MNSKFLIFVLIILSIYFLVNVYLFVRGWQALSSTPSLKPFYCIAFVICCLSFIAMMFGEGNFPDGITAIIYPIGATWLAAMLYFTMCIVFFDILRTINHFIPIFPAVFVANYAKTKLIVLSLSIVVVAITLIIGYYRFTHPVVINLDLNVEKKAGKRKELHIVMASDIHLGHMIKEKRLKKYVEQINSLNPDIVLLAGDIIDRDLNFIIKNDICAEFKNLNAPLGIYAILGNHEYISRHIDDAVDYMQKSGINVLRDSVALIDSSFYVIGRDDHSNPHRNQLSTYTSTIDKSLPVIMLDHQPYHLEDAENENIDLQLSGHTHNGQLFPLNFVTKNMYEVSYGYKAKGKTNIYVSSGLGLWGPPFRIGTKSEIVSITLKFQ